MKQPPFTSHSKCQRGLSLIELMVSLTIGMILMVAIVSAYLGSAGATRMAEAQGRMNEDAQAALSILTQQIRMAGNNPLQNGYTSAQPNSLTASNPVYGTGTVYLPIRGCDGTFSDIPTAANIVSLTCGGVNSNPDSIAISYEADAQNTVATSGGAATDCLGNGLPVPTANGSVIKSNGTTTTTLTPPVGYYVADNRFYIGTSSVITQPSLYCQGNGATNSPQPLVENVEDLQILYGTSIPTSPTDTFTVAGYLTANQVETDVALASATLIPPPQAADPTEPNRWARWSRVSTVRLCVVVRSEQPVVTDTASQQYVKCDGTVDSSQTDLRLRRAYTTTVVLRNRQPPT